MKHYPDAFAGADRQSSGPGATKRLKGWPE
jgi:hypothetical protein